MRKMCKTAHKKHRFVLRKPYFLRKREGGVSMKKCPFAH